MGSLFPGQDPPAPASTSVDGARLIAAATADGDGPGPFVMGAETLAGDAVVNTAGESLGKLEHVMIDVPRGAVAYGVLACGGVFGIGEKLFAIPWSALSLDAGRKCFVLDMSKEKLDAAPGFDRDHWPRMADARWAREIHEYFGVSPYWSADRPLQ